MNCNQYENSTDFHGGRFLLGCLKGIVIDAPIALMKFVWETLKWVWDTGTHPVETYQEASEYIESAKLYLATEYDKAYDRSSRPFRRTKAVSAVSGAVSNMFIKSIQDYLSAEYKEFGCLSFQARTNRVCKIIAEIGLPVGAIKLGPKGIKALMAKKGGDGKGPDGGGDGKGPGGGGDSSGGNVVQAQNKIEMTGTPQVDQFREALRKGTLLEDGNDSKYIFYRKSTEDMRMRNAKVIEVEEGRVVVEDANGGIRVLTSDQLNTASQSSMSKEFFREGVKLWEDSLDPRANQFLQDLKRKGLQLDTATRSNDSSFFKDLFPNTREPRKNQFREALREGKLSEGDNRYISYYGNPGDRWKIPARVMAVEEDLVAIEGIGGVIRVLTRDQLNTASMSNTSKDFFKNNFLEMTSNSQVNQFRQIVNRKDKDDNIYISYELDPLANENSHSRRVFRIYSGKVIDINTDREVTIQKPDGSTLKLNRGQLESARMNKSAWREFDN